MPVPALAASKPEFLAVGDFLWLPLIGLSLALVALAAALGFVRLKRRFVPAPIAPPPPPAPAILPAATPPPARNIPAPELLAVIASAVHCTLAGVPHRIHSITAAEGPLEWAREGRRTLCASHQPH